MEFVVVVAKHRQMPLHAIEMETTDIYSFFLLYVYAYRWKSK